MMQSGNAFQRSPSSLNQSLNLKARARSIAIHDIAANGSALSIFLPTVDGFMVSMRLPRLCCVDSVVWKNQDVRLDKRNV